LQTIAANTHCCTVSLVQLLMPVSGCPMGLAGSSNAVQWQHHLNIARCLVYLLLAQAQGSMGTSNGTSNGISAYMPVQCVREGASSGPLKGYTFAAKDLYDVRSLLSFPCVQCKRILLVSRASCNSSACLKHYISLLASSPPSVPAARLERGGLLMILPTKQTP